MRVLVRYDLGMEAFSYVRDCLAHGWALAHLLSALPIEAGSVFTFLPSGLPNKIVNDFQHGWMTSGRSEWLVPIIKRHLEKSPASFAVFEDICSLSNPGFPSPEDRFFSYHNEVYQFLEPNFKTRSDIMLALRLSRRYPFVGALGVFRDSTRRIKMADKMSLNDLREIVDGTHQLLVGAYDEEGMLVWEGRLD